MPSIRTGPLPEASTRALFGELVSEAAAELGHQPTPLATGYVVDLLEARVRSPQAPPGASSGPTTLAESLVEALLQGGAEGMARLRALGDRALFDAGFFGDSLRRRVVGVRYYTDIGSTAYSRLSRGLADRVPGATASELFRELALCFPDFVELLSGVAERARGASPVDLLRLYDRYRETGSARDRRRLIRRGLILPPPGAERPQ
jgi:hypothetical protein